MSNKEKFEKKKVSPYMKAADDLVRFYDVKRNRLLGEILTTLEATVDEERQLEALKSRIKDILFLTWDELNQEFWENLNWFEKEKRSSTDLEALTNKIIQTHITNYGSAIQNLIKAVFVDQRRASALNKEISRLVHKTRVSIHRAWGQIMVSTFPETTKKAKEDETEKNK